MLILLAIGIHVSFFERGPGSGKPDNARKLPIWAVVVPPALSAVSFVVSVSILLTASAEFASTCSAAPQYSPLTSLSTLPGCFLNTVEFERFEHALRATIATTLGVLFTKSAFRVSDALLCCVR